MGMPTEGQFHVLAVDDSIIDRKLIERTPQDLFLSRERPECLGTTARYRANSYWVFVTFRSVVHTWACRKKGPIYASMFKTLGSAIAVVMGVTFLGDTLYLESLVGITIIAFRFYAVI